MSRLRFRDRASEDFGAVAACPAKAPNNWNFHSPYYRISAAFLQGTLTGTRVRYFSPEGVGTGDYGADRAYKYVANGQPFRAAGYSFYNNGARCIDYPSPHFDMHFVSNEKLLLTNGYGGRYEGKLLK